MASVHIDQRILGVALPRDKRIADPLGLITWETNQWPDIPFALGSIIRRSGCLRIIIDVFEDQIRGHPFVGLPTELQLARQHILTANVAAVTGCGIGRANVIHCGTAWNAGATGKAA